MLRLSEAAKMLLWIWMRLPWRLKNKKSHLMMTKTQRKVADWQRTEPSLIVVAVQE